MASGCEQKNQILTETFWALSAVRLELDHQAHIKTECLMAKTTKKKSTKKATKKPQLKSKFANRIFIGAIDIGSNAIRMVIAEQSMGQLRLVKKFRFPIRLGADVFKDGKISTKNLKLSARTFKKFHELTIKYGIKQIRAVATSALRESKNSAAYIEFIRRKSGIQIEMIDGVEEARLIHLAVGREIDLKDQCALLIDIGGGSVELTFSEKSMMTATHSFPLGTVRMLEAMRKRNLSEAQLAVIIGDFIAPITHFIQSNDPGHPLTFCVGTGGNLEALGRLKPLLLGEQSPTFLSLKDLGDIISKLQKMSIKERIEKLEMRPDRADVILPAALVVQTVMQQSGLNKLLIPHVGLKEGIIWTLANQKNYFNTDAG